MGSTGKGYRAVCADIQSVAGSASDNIVYGGEDTNEETLCAIPRNWNSQFLSYFTTSSNLPRGNIKNLNAMIVNFFLHLLLLLLQNCF